MAFTDGVMAVAITLLVLNLEVPDVPAGQLDDALVDLFPSLIAYLLAFGLIGRFWIIHHRLFETLRQFDALLMALNLGFLALIVLVPFATELWDSYTDEPLAAAVFGSIMGLAALAHWSMTAHTSRRGYVHDPVRQAKPYGSLVTLGVTLVFLLSVPLAFLSTTAAALLWASTLVLRVPLARLGPGDGP
jgi:TMEM175 potassium channel family protein